MNKKIKKLRKLIISHQLESLVALFTLLALLIGIPLVGPKVIVVILIVDLLVLFGPKMLSLGKSYYDGLNLKFLNNSKKTNSKKKKAISSKKKEVMAATKKLEKKEDDIMVKKKKTKNKKGIGRKIFKGLLMLFLICVILGIVAMSLFFGYIVANAPKFDPKNLYTSESTILYDKDGKEFAKIGSQSREKITYDEMADVLVDAIIATEDSRFFQHNGFDLPRFVKASVGQVLGNSSAGGASTLTMQIAKNAYTSTEDRGIKGIIRKFTDIYLAIFKIEKKYSKQEIFEFYANSYYLGGSAYGVEQASLNYFGKHASEVNLSEAALLAGLFQSPGAYDPFNSPERATARRNLVLKLMVRHGYASKEEADAASKIKVEDMLVQSNTQSDNKYQGFIDTVVEEIKEDLGKNPYMVSMKIYTTLDRRVQDVINNVMSGQTFYWENPVVNAGCVAMDPKGGAIAGVCTGRDTSKAGLLNHATQMKRQIGSTSKPLFDYAPSIEYNNTSTYTLLGDEEYAYSDGHAIQNYDGSYKGMITTREAVVDSRNIPALKTFQSVNKKSIIEMVKKMGLSPELDSTGTFLHEAHAIGGYNGESPLTVGAAYNAFGNGGYYYEPHSYTKVIFRDNDEEYVQKTEKVRVMSEETAYMVYSMLVSTAQGSLTRYTNNAIGKTIGAKTGTSNFTQEIKDKYGLAADAVNDLWLVGVTDEYTLSLWYGYDKILSEYHNRFASLQNLYLFAALAKDIYTRDSKIEQPAGVVSVTVERNTIEPLLPSQATPDYLKITELFKKGTEPTKVSPRFDALTNVTNVKANEDSDGQVTVTWQSAKTPEMADSSYLTKYYSKVFTKPNWIASAVNNEIGLTGAMGYDVYLRSSDGTTTSCGTTTGNSITCKPKYNGIYTVIVRTAYASYKANQSSGTSVSVSVRNAGHEFDEDDTKSASVTFKEGTTCSNVTEKEIVSISNGIIPGVIKDFTVTSCNGNNVKGTFTYLTKKYQFNSQLN